MIPDLGYRMADNSRLLRRLFDDRVRSLGLTAVQARLLLALDRHPDCNQGFYAERLEVEPITLTRIVDRMEAAGWIERRADPADRRARILHLTDKARDRVTQVEGIVSRLVSDMLTGLSKREQLQLGELLDRIGSNLAAAREMPEVTHG